MSLNRRGFLGGTIAFVATLPFIGCVRKNSMQLLGATKNPCAEIPLGPPEIMIITSVPRVKIKPFSAKKDENSKTTLAQ